MPGMIIDIHTDVSAIGRPDLKSIKTNRALLNFTYFSEGKQDYEKTKIAVSGRGNLK